MWWVGIRAKDDNAAIVLAIFSDQDHAVGIAPGRYTGEVYYTTITVEEDVKRTSIHYEYQKCMGPFTCRDAAQLACDKINGGECVDICACDAEDEAEARRTGIAEAIPVTKGGE